MTDMLDELVKVTIFEGTSDPVAMAYASPNPQTAGLPVVFNDNGSYDPDGGGILLYEWDWENDGIYDEQGNSLSHTWDTIGTYYVQYRVSDDEGETGELGEPLAIEIMAIAPEYPVDITPSNLSSGNDLCVLGNYLFVAAGSAGLRIIDIEMPEAAYIVTEVATPTDASRLDVVDGYAYVLDGSDWLYIIDVDPVNPAVIVNSVGVTGDSRGGVKVSGGYAYVGLYEAWDGEFQTYDIDPPGTASLVNSVDLPQGALDIAISGNYALIADRYAGLQVINIGAPGYEFLDYSISLPDCSIGICTSGNYAYVISSAPDYIYYDSYLNIIDISDPASASLVTSLQKPGVSAQYTDVAVTDGIAYITEYNRRLYYVDVETPASASNLNSIFVDCFSTRRIVEDSGYLYVVGGLLRIIKLP